MEKNTVALRCLSLGSYIVRGELDISVRNQENKDFLKSANELVELLYSWMEKEDLLNYLTSDELESFSKPLGDWNNMELIKAIWKNESLGTLLWALSLIPQIPPYDNLFIPERLIENLTLFRPKEQFLEKVELRSENEIKRERDIAEYWFWRLQIFDMEKKDESFSEKMNIKEIISSVAEKAYLEGYISEPIEGDFPILGKPFKYITLDEYLQISYIIVERYNTLNWLCDYEKN
ncbi:MAG: DUF4272 domain-containing protein [Dictyoglomaceae bacterium]|nr:DUF4272 domain-containing protein [Dictyoglomaceae bacterium]